MRTLIALAFGVAIGAGVAIYLSAREELDGGATLPASGGLSHE